MFNLKSKLSALLATLVCGSAAIAQDSGALIDLLVKKGVLNDQEAENVRAELTKEFVANSSAGKLNLSTPVVDFKISGDMRLRYEYNNQAPEVATGGFLLKNETSRQRFRFRLNGDVTLQKGWTTGFALESGQSSDSANQTFTNMADDYGVYIARAYIGWQPNLNWAFVLGKQKNIMYTTDLRWDADINPQGVSELYKYFIGSKDTFEVRAMQHAMQDRTAANNVGPLHRDAWLFENQLVYTHWFAPDNLSSAIFALGFNKYSQSTTVTADGILNSSAFVGPFRKQDFVTFAGEVNWANVNGAGTAFKLYWDSSKNLDADARAYRIYGLNPAQFSSGGTAWLAGIGYSYGTGKVQGDYSFKLDYRSVGITATDPNINDSDWGFSKDNQKGFEFTSIYNLTDFVTIGAKYYDTKIIQKGLTFSLGNLDHSQELLVDLVLKF